MRLLAKIEVVPDYAQVELSDANAQDYPQWQTGEELAVAHGTRLSGRMIQN